MITWFLKKLFPKYYKKHYFDFGTIKTGVIFEHEPTSKYDMVVFRRDWKKDGSLAIDLSYYGFPISARLYNSIGRKKTLMNINQSTLTDMTDAFTSRAMLTGTGSFKPNTPWVLAVNKTSIPLDDFLIRTFGGEYRSYYWGGLIYVVVQDSHTTLYFEYYRDYRIAKLVWK